MPGHLPFGEERERAKRFTPASGGKKKKRQRESERESESGQVTAEKRAATVTRLHVTRPVTHRLGARAREIFFRRRRYDTREREESNPQLSLGHRSVLPLPLPLPLSLLALSAARSLCCSRSPALARLAPSPLPAFPSCPGQIRGTADFSERASSDWPFLSRALSGRTCRVDTNAE